MRAQLTDVDAVVPATRARVRPARIPAARMLAVALIALCAIGLVPVLGRAAAPATE